ncbi:serine/threonine kinase [Cystobacter fuscus DSM 2262]|uniref:histidine kinase n=1 Tax=Cystobacter fuscus (strain ATCC 25194 / DSM 2262 / NBRC 100088 / M29) TaxID=1242864 RepID=S9Q832_CYSF2|nr:trifunctional serine/threonine-protein kinase/ATP-binding protein/sensor histidine kinase [Cystobacter fuscus]EPX57494.1 serine/threonine kinase [Cystobacter fuscus DSM 2262]
MLTIPGYTLRGAFRSTSTNRLFHAVSDADGTSLVLKTPLTSGPDPQALERYRREFDILQRLRDVRGVSRALGCEVLQERPVLLFEAVEGEPLSTLVGRPFEVLRALELALSLVSTLAEVHRHGVIHKDIKPANIVVTSSGDARLVDFGAATFQLVEHVEAAPATLIEGTLAYMSPEQTGRMNRAVDHRSDFYSLGVTLYEVLTGSRPFQARDALEWFHAHMAQAPQPPRERVPDLPPVLSAIVLKLMAKVAEERYQSAEGLAADLARCRDSLLRGVHEDFPLGEHDHPTHFQLPQRLYGRGSEAAALLQGFERVAQSGRPELFLVRGYSGIGKSAVVHELHRPVVRQRGFFLSGKFDQLQRDIPYITLAQAIRGLTQQLLASTDEELARWSARLNEAWEGQGQVLVDVVPQLELVAGKQPSVGELPPAEARHRFQLVLRKFLGVFATPEHPLVLFLDDLQWADLASLQLLHQLLTHPETPPVLLIGAYRDNEVDASHLVAQTVDGLRAAGARMTELHLEPLTLEEVRRFVADALPGAGDEVLESLPVLALEKTGGNPFFLQQFLLTLHQDGLLVRLPKGPWRWDAAASRARGYSDNVVDFMAGKLRQLPLGTQHLLRLAACVGNAFSLELLRLISHMEESSEVSRGLAPALQEGMLMRTGPGEQFRFLHDRIQQAAQALIPEPQRKAVHLRIGRLLLERLPPETVQDQLFDIVSHLNAGMELIDDPTERLRLARLNAKAGRNAKATTAFRSAAAYLATAYRLIPGDPWEADPALAFRIQLDRATCEFMSGKAAEARHLVEELLPRARTRTDTAAVYRLKSSIHVAASEISAALVCLVECLTQMGYPMSATPSWDEVLAANEEVWALLGERSIESLIELPRMTDPDIEAAMSVLGAMFAPAYFTNTKLLIVNLCRMVCLSIRHGLNGSAAQGYGWYGLVLGSIFKRYQEGHAFGQLAGAIVERHELSTFRGKMFYIQGTLSDWTEPLGNSLELMRRGFHHALQASDLLIASYCCNHIVAVRRMLGHHLEEVDQESVIRLAFVRKASFPDVQSVVHHVQRFVRQLRGVSTFGSLTGEDFDEATFEAGLTPARMSTMRCWYWSFKMQARFLAGAWAEALEAGNRAAELAWASFCQIQLLDFHLFHALSLAACHAKMTPEQRSSAKQTLQQHHQQLAEWAAHQPSTFRGPERMVFAEMARLEDREGEALRAYEEAHESARAHGFIQHVALACELAARFWYERKLKTLGDSYARQARDAWAGWGAHGKVQHLEAQWPHLAASPMASERAEETNSTKIDALTLVKAQQAVSGEIVLERLAATVLRAAIENAGAQRGALLLPHGDKLSVVSVVGPSPEDTTGADESRLPWSLIAYTRRTREHVLIGDVSQPHPFSADPWLERGGARSVLCLPLLRQEAFRGVLYLENGLATNAFTPSRLALLGHLASQAAISIENARLYAEVQRAEAALRAANDELEKRVEERTHELKQAQARLVGAARAVGMAEVAANVLHNVGNVLTSAVVNLQSMTETVNVSRMGRLKQISTLLEEHQGDLADFLTRDPRGLQLPAYFSALGDELLREQRRLQDSMGAMSKHLDHIRVIVQVQQSYSHGTLLTEECELSQLVDDALSIQLPSLQHHGVSVTQELVRLPRVRLDKHKVLQILVNLISNAKNAMDGLPEGRRHLRVRLWAQDDRACIQVVDTGMGFTPEIRERLFAQGFTTREGGHGLGLHSSALAAKLLGGRLTLESEGPGLGATATLELPLG